MKAKLIVAVVAILALGTALFGDVPLVRTFYGDVSADSLYYVEVTADYDTGFQLLETIIPVLSDSGVVVVELSGVATMSQGERLFLGIGSNSAATTAAEQDTFNIAMPRGFVGEMQVPFNFAWSYSNDGALTDSIFVCGAVGGSTVSERVTINDVHIIARTTDQ